MTKVQKDFNEAKVDGLIFREVLVDLLDVRRCGLTRQEVAVATDTNYSQVIRMIDGENGIHLEWAAALGRYVAERYGNYRIAKWVAGLYLPEEMYSLIEDVEDHK